MALYVLDHAPEMTAPIAVVAFDGWVDAGAAASTAAGLLARAARAVATFDADLLYDYRARRPSLEIVDGKPGELGWPELLLRHRRFGDRDVVILTGPEPDFRWRRLCEAVVELARRFQVVEWISLGSIPAAVPHTRPVPILGTSSGDGHLRGDVQRGPDGILRVPAAALSVLDVAVAAAAIPTVGYFAQVPHYVTGPYPAATVELLRLVAEHVGTGIATAQLREDARKLGAQLDVATSADETTRAHVERLEAMVDEARRPSGGDLISEIEQFLRERGGEADQGGARD
jgi:hypothetical protein